jgi:hypothetical protein
MRSGWGWCPGLDRAARSGPLKGGSGSPRSADARSGPSPVPCNRLFRSSGRFRARDTGSGPVRAPERRLTAKFGIVDEQVEHALKICLVAAAEGEAGASTTSLFSGISLVSTQTPAAMASSSASDRPSRSDGSTNRAALERSSSRLLPETQGRKRIRSDSWRRKLWA